jgi:hypothetical protein
MKLYCLLVSKLLFFMCFVMCSITFDSITLHTINSLIWAFFHSSGISWIFSELLDINVVEQRLLKKFLSKTVNISYKSIFTFFRVFMVFLDVIHSSCIDSIIFISWKSSSGSAVTTEKRRYISVFSPSLSVFPAFGLLGSIFQSQILVFDLYLIEFQIVFWFLFFWSQVALKFFCIFLMWCFTLFLFRLYSWLFILSCSCCFSCLCAFLFGHF